MKAWTAALLVGIGLLLTSCDDSDGGDVTPTSTQALSSTPTPASAPVPDEPTALTDYPATIAEYASANPAAAGSCFANLLEAWAMPALSPEAACRVANTDADEDDELALVATAPVEGALSYVVFVLDPAATGYDVAFESPTYPAPADTARWTPLLFAGDINSDGIGDIVYTSQLCAEHGCFNSAYILQGSTTGYSPITPEAGIGVVDGLFRIGDPDAAGARTLLATGTPAAPPEAGPQRQVVQTWAWNGAAYALSDSSPGETSRFLYHRVLDADALLENADYAGAENSYLSFVGDTGVFLLWKPEANERNELEAYSLFRAALAHLLAGGDPATANGYLDRAKALPNTLHAQLAASFQAGYAAKGEIGVGCTAVDEDVRFNDVEYEAFWDYGTDNPTFDAAHVCPF